MLDLIEQFRADGVLKNPLIIQAFEKVRRGDFLRPETLAEVAGNYPLPIGFGQTISQPFTVAFMLELLNPRPGEKILDVGAGSGWQTALLACCVNQKIPDPQFQMPNKKGIVYALERIPELVEFAQNNLDKYGLVESGSVELKHGDGWQGWLEAAPFDKIIVAAAAKEIPEVLKEQLKVGGRLVMPVGGYPQSIIALDKINQHEFKELAYPGFVFVPLVKSVY